MNGRVMWRRFCAAAIFPALAGATSLRAENWPAWRGPFGNGVSGETGLPAAWNEWENVLWTADLPGPAAATPAVWGDHIFVPSAAGAQLLLICYDTTGEVRWMQRVAGGNQALRSGEGNSACISPVTDGSAVYVMFSTGDLACYDFEGNEVWRTDLQQRYGAYDLLFMMSSSPVLYGDMLYVHAVHGGRSYVLALDKTTGDERWFRERGTKARGESMHSYSSPVLYRSDTDPLLLSLGAGDLMAIDLMDGTVRWRCYVRGSARDIGPRIISSPTFEGRRIYAAAARNGPVLCIQPDGAKGDISRKRHVLWRTDEGGPDVPSPLVKDGLVYLCREANGLISCLDAATGERIYRERIHVSLYRGSPVYADGKIYLPARDGTVTVIQAGRQFNVLGENRLDEPITASPAVANGRIYFRTHDRLWCIGSPEL